MSSLTRTMSYFMGTVHLKMQVGLLSCLDDFFVMPPKSMVLAMILGTPWLWKYKALPDWDTNAIHYKQEDRYVNQPFVPAGSTTSLTQHKVITNKGKQKAASSDNHPSSKTKLHITQAQNTTSFLTSQSTQSLSIKDTTPHRQWVEKRLVKAQEGQAQMWVPENNPRHQNNSLEEPNLSLCTSTSTRLFKQEQQAKRVKTQIV